MDIKWEALGYGIAGGAIAIVLNQTWKNKGGAGLESFALAA